MRRLLALALLALAPLAGRAQPLGFGSSDDPLESPLTLFESPPFVGTVYAGPAYVGSEWTLGLALDAEGQRGSLRGALAATIHVDEDGLYRPEVDEPIDALRAVRYLRLEPTARRPLYVRFGPLQRVELGTGHLVRGFGTWAAPDERAPGLEAAAVLGPVEATAFVEDVRLDGVVGGSVSASPFRRAAGPRLQSVRLTLAAVHDLGLHGESATTAGSADARFDLVRIGGIALSPWASYARYLEHGQSLGVGADVGASDLVGTARVRLRLGAFASSNGFTPGYFSPLYALSNPRDRIVVADTYYDADTTSTGLAAVPLDSARGGLDLVGELRILAFGQFEVYQHLRRHVGVGEQSAYAARFAFRPRDPNGVRLAVAFERQDFKSFFGLFSRLKDENALVLDVDAPLPYGLRLSVRSRYGYRRLEDDGDARRFLVQRRFEPLVGIRAVF